jgi:hypothetical protein
VSPWWLLLCENGRRVSGSFSTIGSQPHHNPVVSLEIAGNRNREQSRRPEEREGFTGNSQETWRAAQGPGAIMRTVTCWTTAGSGTMNERQKDMTSLNQYARRTLEIVNAVGAGFLVAFLGAPDPTIDLTGDDASSLRESAQPSPRVILMTADARPTTGAAAGTMGWTGTLTLDTMGVTLPVVVVDSESLPPRFFRDEPAHVHAA